MSGHIQEVPVMELPHQGSFPDGGMLQTKTKYSTAVQVIRPRDLIGQVLNKCLEEASIAGEDFYYSWKQGGSTIEGGTIGMALAIARNMGNNAVDVEVQESHASYLFIATYIDLETGFNIRRAFRQNKTSPKKKDGGDTYSGERGQDVIFQIGQSKALRNVIFNAAPNWLVRKVLEKSKENVIEKVKKMGVPAASQLIMKKIEALKIPLDRVEKSYGKSSTWDAEKVVMLTTAIRSIEDGRERIDDIFPGEPEKTTTENMSKAVSDAMSKPKGEKKEKTIDKPAESPVQDAKAEPVSEPTEEQVKASVDKCYPIHIAVEKATTKAELNQAMLDINKLRNHKEILPKHYEEVMAKISEKNRSVKK